MPHWLVETEHMGMTIVLAYEANDPDDAAGKALAEEFFHALMEIKTKNKVTVQQAAKLIDREKIRSEFRIKAIKRMAR